MAVASPTLAKAGTEFGLRLAATFFFFPVVFLIGTGIRWPLTSSPAALASSDRT
jgi:hypothetical protein